MLASEGVGLMVWSPLAGACSRASTTARARRRRPARQLRFPAGRTRPAARRADSARRGRRGTWRHGGAGGAGVAPAPAGGDQRLDRRQPPRAARRQYRRRRGQARPRDDLASHRRRERAAQEYPGWMLERQGASCNRLVERRSGASRRQRGLRSGVALPRRRPTSPRPTATVLINAKQALPGARPSASSERRVMRASSRSLPTARVASTSTPSPRASRKRASRMLSALIASGRRVAIITSRARIAHPERRAKRRLDPRHQQAPAVEAELAQPVGVVADQARGQDHPGLVALGPRAGSPGPTAPRSPGRCSATRPSTSATTVVARRVTSGMAWLT